jgi:Na+/proline symporter
LNAEGERERKENSVRRTILLSLIILLALMVLGACGPITVQVPEDLNINLGTALPGTTLVVPTGQPGVTVLPATEEPGGTPVVPVTGDDNTFIGIPALWLVIGLVLLFAVIVAVALMARPTTTTGTTTVIEREEIHREDED